MISEFGAAWRRHCEDDKAKELNFNGCESIEQAAVVLDQATKECIVKVLRNLRVTYEDCPVVRTIEKKAVFIEQMLTWWGDKVSRRLRTVARMRGERNSEGRESLDSNGGEGVGGRGRREGLGSRDGLGSSEGVSLERGRREGRTVYYDVSDGDREGGERVEDEAWEKIGSSKALPIDIERGGAELGTSEAGQYEAVVKKYAALNTAVSTPVLGPMRSLEQYMQERSPLIQLETPTGAPKAWIGPKSPSGPDLISGEVVDELAFAQKTPQFGSGSSERETEASKPQYGEFEVVALPDGRKLVKIEDGKWVEANPDFVDPNPIPPGRGESLSDRIKASELKREEGQANSLRESRGHGLPTVSEAKTSVRHPSPTSEREPGCHLCLLQNSSRFDIHRRQKVLEKVPFLTEVRQKQARFDIHRRI